MSRSLLAALAAVLVLTASHTPAEEKKAPAKDAAKSVAVTVVSVDAKKGEIVLKYADAQGKGQEKTFRLTDDIRFLDETGRVVKLDVFRAGQDALVVESEGKLKELRSTLNPHQGRRLSDMVKILIEMTDCEDGCVEEVQRIYDILRTLDTDKSGKINADALKNAREKLVAERIDDLIKRVDTDKDGRISKDEARGRLKEHFEKIDTNKDGYLSRDELLKAAMEKHEAENPKPEKK